ncbi:hypothetical protein HDU97_003830 [Phlyctochytrium planicorne]|nr:hypothetical protein HDU97_003830 [Phlyctochytrium planicorne]
MLASTLFHVVIAAAITTVSAQTDCAVPVPSGFTKAVIDYVSISARPATVIIMRTFPNCLSVNYGGTEMYFWNYGIRCQDNVPWVYYNIRPETYNGALAPIACSNVIAPCPVTIASVGSTIWVLTGNYAQIPKSYGINGEVGDCFKITYNNLPLYFKKNLCRTDCSWIGFPFTVNYGDRITDVNQCIPPSPTAVTISTTTTLYFTSGETTSAGTSTTSTTAITALTTTEAIASDGATTAAFIGPTSPTLSPSSETSPVAATSSDSSSQVTTVAENPPTLPPAPSTAAASLSDVTTAAETIAAAQTTSAAETISTAIFISSSANASSETSAEIIPTTSDVSVATGSTSINSEPATAVSSSTSAQIATALTAPAITAAATNQSLPSTKVPTSTSNAVNQAAEPTTGNAIAPSSSAVLAETSSEANLATLQATAGAAQSSSGETIAVASTVAAATGAFAQATAAAATSFRTISHAVSSVAAQPSAAGSAATSGSVATTDIATFTTGAVTSPVASPVGSSSQALASPVASSNNAVASTAQESAVQSSGVALTTEATAVQSRTAAASDSTAPAFVAQSSAAASSAAAATVATAPAQATSNAAAIIASSSGTASATLAVAASASAATNTVVNSIVSAAASSGPTGTIVDVSTITTTATTTFYTTTVSTSTSVPLPTTITVLSPVYSSVSIADWGYPDTWLSYANGFVRGWYSGVYWRVVGNTPGLYVVGGTPSAPYLYSTQGLEQGVANTRIIANVTGYGPLFCRGVGTDTTNPPMACVLYSTNGTVLDPYFLRGNIGTWSSYNLSKRKVTFLKPDRAWDGTVGDQGYADGTTNSKGFSKGFYGPVYYRAVGDNPNIFISGGVQANAYLYNCKGDLGYSGMRQMASVQGYGNLFCRGVGNNGANPDVACFRFDFFGDLVDGYAFMGQIKGWYDYTH